MKSDIDTTTSDMPTSKQVEAVFKACRDIFSEKLKDYGPSWRIMRPTTLTDQLMIKALRIRQLEETGINLVGEGILPEFIAIVNYSLIGIIQYLHPSKAYTDISQTEALRHYDKYAQETMALLNKKNHDYGEAWRMMRVSSYTDLILTKLHRIKQIEDNNGHTHVSEGITSNYMDICNYAVFGVIRLTQRTD